MTERRLWWLPWLLLVALLAWQALTRTTVSNDVSAFLPASHDAEQALLLDTLREGATAGLWLVVVEGAGAEELAIVANDLARRLRDSGRFRQVLDGRLELDPDTRALLLRYRYLLDPEGGPQQWTTEALHRALTQRLEELGTPLAPLQKALLPRDPTAALRRVVAQLAPDGRSRVTRYRGAWMSADHRRAFLVLQSAAPGMDLDAQQHNLELIRRAFDRAAAGTDARLRLSGAPWFALQSRDRIRAESRRLSLLASLFLIGFMLWVWRDPRRVLLAALPLGLGVLAGVAVTGWLFGSLHGITLAFGITLLGVALDYPVHLFAHQRPGEAAGVALRRIWPTLRLGVLTTLIGYAAMALTGFPGLAQLGVFSIAGLLMAAATVRGLLPPLLPPPCRPPRLLGVADWLSRHAPPRRPGLLALGLLLVSGPLMLATGGDPWSHDVRDLSPVPAELRRADGALRRTLGVAEPGYLIVVRGRDTEQVLQREQRLQPLLAQARDQGWLLGYEMAASRTPPATVQRRRQAALPDAPTLHTRFNRALRDLPFREDAFAPFFRDVAASRTLAPLRPQDLAGTPLDPALAGLLHAGGTEARGLVRLQGLSRPDALRQALQAAALPGVRLLDLTAATSRLMDDFRREALSRVLLGAALILVLLLLALRRPARVFAVLAAVLAAISGTLALLVLLGGQLTLFHLVALLLVAGLGIDYGLFFTREDKGEEAGRTALAVLVSGVSTVGVFAILAPSGISVLHALGLTVALGTALAFLAAWTLPGLLRHLHGKGP